MFTSFSAEQSRLFIDTQQTYDAYLSAAKSVRAHGGGMHWKAIGGRDYLYKTLDSRGNAKCLGPRSAETERIAGEFHAGKAVAADNLRRIQEKLKEQARFAKAARINRVPNVVTAILRQLERNGLLGANLVVIGTNALYAYEAAAACRMETQILATMDMDLLWNAKARLAIAALDDDLKKTGFIGLLKAVDKSFEPVYQRGYRAVNRDGYFVDLIKPASMKTECDSLGEQDGLFASEIPSIKWLVSSPKFKRTVIGHDGFPATMIAPDPRAFALYKIWLSQQPDREPLKKERDRLQAIAVARLVIEHLPALPFRQEDLKAFPLEVIGRGAESMDGMPNGFFGLG